MEFIKLTKGTDAITIFNNLGFFKLSKDSGGEDLPATTSLVYTLSSDGTYYIVGTGFTDIATIDADTSGGTAGSGLDSTWTGGRLVIPAEHNGLPVKAVAPRAFATIKNITEAYLSDGITCIGHRAFQCTSDTVGFDTTMTSIKLPNTLISIGGFRENGAGRVLWGRQALKNVEINFNEITPSYDVALLCFQSQFAYVKADTLILNASVPTNEYTTFRYAFQYAEINKVVINNFSNLSYAFNVNTTDRMFYNAKINELHLNGVTDFGNPSKTYSSLVNSDIKRIYFNSNVRFMYRTGTSAMRVFGDVSSKVFINAPQSTLYQTNSLDLTNAKLFFNKDYFDYYTTATNWVNYLPNGSLKTGNYNTYGKFLEGETLPTQLGTTQVYNVTWYEDDDFTTLASGTATDTKEYYGKISAVV